MYRLDALIGTEHELDSVNRTLRDFAQHQRASAVGAVHVTCSDESEREPVESFQHWFAEPLLPELKFWSKSPMRTANLGARYEWGAARLAEQHFAAPETRDAFKLLVVKINAHVSLVESAGQIVYGHMDRYANPSNFCGALHALMDGRAQGPAIDDLREAFCSEGKDRLGILRDPQQVDPALRSLFAAVASARLQARRAIVDIQDYQPRTPTVFLVLPCVTLDRKHRDTELVVGRYWADFRAGSCPVQYRGLGDDPSTYRLQHRHRLVRMEDEQLHQPRAARDHREDVLSQWQQRRQPSPVDDPRLKEVVRRATRATSDDPRLACETLTTLLWLLADLAPIPASILLFAKGAAGIHHLYRVHCLARGVDDLHGARRILADVASNVDVMPADTARETVDLLLGHYRG